MSPGQDRGGRSDTRTGLGDGRVLPGQDTKTVACRQDKTEVGAVVPDGTKAGWIKNSLCIFIRLTLQQRKKEDYKIMKPCMRIHVY